MNAAEDFANLRFKLDCATMQFVAADGNVIAAGLGEIWQNDRGVLKYKAYLEEEAYPRFLEIAFQSREIGSVIPEDHYLTLHAQELNGDCWIAHRVSPRSSPGTGRTLSEGKLNDLKGTRDWSGTKAHIWIRLRGKLDFPCNSGTQTVVHAGGRERSTFWAADCAHVEDGELTFEARYVQDHTLLTLSLPVEQLTPATPLRLIEAFQFILGRELSPLVIQTSHEGTIATRLRSPIEGHGSIEPPLAFNASLESSDVWRIFTTYFRHVHADPTPLQWHPISRHVGSVIESSTASLDIRILALSVAVEGLASQCFPNLAPPTAEFLNDLERLSEILDGGGFGQSCLDRVKGAIGNMRSARGSDILRAFLKTHHLPIALLRSWSGLRNSAAHGGAMDIENIASDIRLMHQTMGLLYALVLQAIGYVGPRKDYSVAGWPNSPWPPPPRQSDEQAEMLREHLSADSGDSSLVRSAR